GLLQMKATPIMRKIALLGKFAYPELRLFNQFLICPSLPCVHGTVTTIFDLNTISSLKRD
ncbi:hypothetical protein, partial [Pseudoalteromonas sp. MMG012]|uniref:hypothetical protein n=1 Tax=Pseudoalteromonas sp. MMG012 TaxID=2822686 RepID=UPI001B39F7F5